MSTPPTRLRLMPSEGGVSGANRLVLYDWFTRVGSPPRGGNRAVVLVDGEEAWDRVAADLERARADVRIATWMCRPDIELVRPAETSDAPPAARANRRLGALVEALAARGVHVRLLIWGMTRTPILDPWLRRWNWRGGEHIHLLEQDHRRLIGSYHQKTLTIDHRVGYCGGMNLKENDWDTPAHRVFEPRREPHRSDADRRRAVAERRRPSKFPPRHDLMVRLEGPAVADLEETWRSRWNDSAERRRRSLVGRVADWIRARLGQPPLGPVPPLAPQVQGPGGLTVQVVRTSPGGERGIFDAYRRAIRNARRCIYIENQYFRSTLLSDELARALRRNPRLRLAVVVNPIDDGEASLISPAGFWTARMQETVQRARPEFRLSRLLVHDLSARGTRVWRPIDVHAKVMIIDDEWLTVGSANLNDRGLSFEGEINVAIQDSAVARRLRLRLMAEHLEIPAEEADNELGDIDDAFDLWAYHARANAVARQDGRAPRSRVHAFVQEAEPTPPFGVGPTVF